MRVPGLPYDPDHPPAHLALDPDASEEIEIQYQVDCQRLLTVEQRIDALERLSAEYQALLWRDGQRPHPQVVERT